jgi:hypothetical protein
MDYYPLGSNEEGNFPSHVKCSNPTWTGPEQVKLDVTVNGYDYSGDFTFTFYDNLDLYRAVPMAGPNEGKTRVKLFGSGFSSSKEDVHVKWGVVET